MFGTAAEFKSGSNGSSSSSSVDEVNSSDAIEIQPSDLLDPLTEEPLTHGCVFLPSGNTINETTKDAMLAKKIAEDPYSRESLEGWSFPRNRPLEALIDTVKRRQEQAQKEHEAYIKQQKEIQAQRETMDAELQKRQAQIKKEYEELLERKKEIEQDKKQLEGAKKLLSEQQKQLQKKEEEQRERSIQLQEKEKGLEKRKRLENALKVERSNHQKTKKELVELQLERDHLLKELGKQQKVTKEGLASTNAEKEKLAQQYDEQLRNEKLKLQKQMEAQLEAEKAKIQRQKEVEYQAKQEELEKQKRELLAQKEKLMKQLGVKPKTSSPPIPSTTFASSSSSFSSCSSPNACIGSSPSSCSSSPSSNIQKPVERIDSMSEPHAVRAKVKNEDDLHFLMTVSLYFYRMAQVECSNQWLSLAQRACLANASDTQWKASQSVEYSLIQRFVGALCYERGIGVEQDFGEAMSLIDVPSTLRYPPAQFMQAEYYLKGIGGQKDQQTAFDLLKAAADSGYAPGFFGLASCYEKGEGVVQKDEAKAVQNYQQAAKLNDPLAMKYLSEIYAHGLLGQAKNEPRAVKYLRLYQVCTDRNNKFVISSPST